MLTRNALIPRALIPYLLLLAFVWISCLGFKWQKTAVSTVIDYTDNLFGEYNSEGFRTPRENFISSAFETTLTGDFDVAAIQNICSDHSWVDDVVFQCDKIIGGIGNVRQELLTCIRWAMESGVAMVLPQVRPRSDANSTLGEEVKHAYKPAAALDHFFDTELFLSRMEESCPQMTFYKDLDSLPAHAQVENIGILGTKRGYSKQNIRQEGVKWISEHRSGVGNISLVTFYRSFASYEVCNDGLACADSFGQFLTFRSDVRRLAAAVLYELSERFSLNINPGEAINKNAFLGIHLRTAADAVKAGWSSYETQSELYLRYAAEFQLPAIYIASGNLSSISMFAERVSPTPVVTKFTLLSGDDLMLLQSLSWDQQGQVDYLVLQKASQFLGITDSSFSWGVAAARHAMSSGGSCGKQEGSRRLAKRLEKDISFRDDLTVIVGAKNKLDFNTKWFWP